MCVVLTDIKTFSLIEGHMWGLEGAGEVAWNGAPVGSHGVWAYPGFGRMEGEPGVPHQAPMVRNTLGGSAWLSLSPCLDASHAPALGTELMKT